MRIIKTFIVFLISVLIISCATGSVIITGETRPAIDPIEVKVYLDPPTKFETIGIVEAKSDVEFSRQTAQDRVLVELKSRAAKIGANGVLLINTSSQTSNSVGVFSNGFMYFGSSDTILGQGKAIFVIEE